MQDCGNGNWNNWTEIPKDGNKPRFPSPSVTVMKNGTLLQVSANSGLRNGNHGVHTLICFLAMWALLI
jgi:hypothetical protein